MTKNFTKKRCENSISCISTISLRANKALASWGIEGRVPFLDKELMDVAMSINPKDKDAKPERELEKWVLRKAFENLLPE